MTQKQQDIFFALLRFAIWQNDGDEGLRMRDAQILNTIAPHDDWEAILTAATEHSVLGILGAAMDYIPQNLRPSTYQSDMLVMFTLKLNGCRDEMLKAIKSVFQLIENEGARPVLLKGEGLAQLYPRSCQRAVGDIDVYVGATDFERVCIAIDKANGKEPDRSAYTSECEHHYHTEYNGFELEIHHCIADVTWDRDAEKINQWAEQMLATCPLRTMMISGKEILLPSVQFDMFYIFQHLCKHILNEGGGLRQLIDWAMYLHHVYSQQLQYDKDALLQTLKEYDYLPSWQILAGILHHQFGLPIAEIPFYDEKMASKSQTSILQDILSGGNFGQYNRDDSAEQLPHGIKRTLLVFRNMYCNYRKKRILFPRMAGRSFIQNFIIGMKCRIAEITK